MTESVRGVECAALEGTASLDVGKFALEEG